MLHKLTSSYREIAKYFPELKGKLSLPNRNRQLLLQMAERGDARPSWRTLIGQFLIRCTAEKQKLYNPTFTKRIKRLAPQWFVFQSEIANDKKQRLLRAAGAGGERPKQRTELGRALCRYTSRKSPSFDLSFANQIKKIAPHWFIPKKYFSNKKKAKLLLMAKKGETRPSQKTTLGRSLSNYTCKKYKYYDPLFTKQIKKLAPHWFKRCSTN